MKYRLQNIDWNLCKCKKSQVYWPRKQSPIYERRVTVLPDSEVTNSHETYAILHLHFFVSWAQPCSCSSVNHLKTVLRLNQSKTLTVAFISKELSWSLWKVSVSFGSKVMVNCYFFFSFFSLQGSLEKLFSFCFSMQALIFTHVTLGNIIFEKKNILRKMCGAWVPSHGGTQSSSIHLDFLFFCA